MEKARLISFASHVLRWLLALFHFAFGVFVLFLVVLAFEDDIIREYCIEAPKGKPYDFVWDGRTLCRIDWSFFLVQFFGQILVVYGVFIGPLWFVKFLLGRIKPGPPR